MITSAAAAFPSTAIGFWFVAVLLLVGGAAAAVARRYVLAGTGGFLGFISILLALGAMPVANGGEAAAFWICALASVPAAVVMVIAKKAVHSAICLAIVMISLAILYAAQHAPFLAFVQIIVYTGAVLMLFLFVVMLIGVESSDALVETIRGQRVATVVLGFGFLLLLLCGVGAGLAGSSQGSLAQANADGNVFGLARLIFTRYVFAFEVTSALLITAALGAMVLAHRERAERVSQKVLQRRRIAGPHPSPLSPPGVYARHNAVDTPALLPDGTPAEDSVHAVFRGGRTGHARELPPELEAERSRTRTVVRRVEEQQATGGGSQATDTAADGVRPDEKEGLRPDKEEDDQ